MQPITAWYKVQVDHTFRYSHSTQGHTTTRKSGWLYDNVHLDTSTKINKEIDGKESKW